MASISNKVQKGYKILVGNELEEKKGIDYDMRYLTIQINRTDLSEDAKKEYKFLSRCIELESMPEFILSD